MTPAAEAGAERAAHDPLAPSHAPVVTPALDEVSHSAF